MSISKNKVVSIHYTLKNDNGDIIDKSEKDSPLSFIFGIGSIIAGLEKELEGKAVGDKFDTRIDPKEGYGERRDELVQVVPKEHLGDIEELQEGMQLQGQSENGDIMIFTVAKIEGNNITLDSNHPLAGVALNFSVEVVEVRDATSEEIDHGHVH